MDATVVKAAEEKIEDKRRHHKFLPLWIVLGVLVAALVGFVVYLLLRNRGSVNTKPTSYPDLKHKSVLKEQLPIKDEATQDQNKDEATQDQIDVATKNSEALSSINTTIGDLRAKKIHKSQQKQSPINDEVTQDQLNLATKNSEALSLINTTIGELRAKEIHKSQQEQITQKIKQFKDLINWFEDQTYDKFTKKLKRQMLDYLTFPKNMLVKIDSDKAISPGEYKYMEILYHHISLLTKYYTNTSYFGLVNRLKYQNIHFMFKKIHDIIIQLRNYRNSEDKRKFEQISKVSDILIHKIYNKPIDYIERNANHISSMCTRIYNDLRIYRYNTLDNIVAEYLALFQ